MRHPFLLAIALLGQTACSGALADGDGRAFGDDLGQFQVQAHLDRSTCGPGAAETDVEFPITLSRKDPILYWSTGADAAEGELARDGKHFTASAEAVRELGENKDPEQKCVVVRKDVIEAELDDAKNTTGFTGTFDSQFKQQGDGDCTVPLLDLNFDTLPCSMSYSMVGKRAAAK